MREATVHVGARRLEGRLGLPDAPCGIVAFAHGSGSSRLSPRNRFAAGRIEARGMATLLFDLLTEEEAADRANVFDIPLLGARVAEAIGWIEAEPRLAGLPIGLFGASTGAAAALTAAAARPDAVAAVVSRGGRPDLAAPVLAGIRCPTLLIVGGEDRTVLELNRRALALLGQWGELTVIAGATHLFEEPGTLEAAIEAAADWFETHLGGRGAADA